MGRAITEVQTDIQRLNTLWQAAQAQYETTKASLTAEIDDYMDHHQNAADSHSLEIRAAKALKATLVPVVAAAQTDAAKELEGFVLSRPGYQGLAKFFKRNWRWFAYAGGLAVMGEIIVHLHK